MHLSTPCSQTPYNNVGMAPRVGRVLQADAGRQGHRRRTRRDVSGVLDMVEEIRSAEHCSCQFCLIKGQHSAPHRLAGVLL